MAQVRVGLDERAYDVHIAPGLLARAGELIAPLAGSGRVLIVTDQTLQALHAPVLAASLRAAGLDCSTIAVIPGEGAKSFPSLAQLCEEMVAAGLNRSDLVVALGGGVVGDLAGFASAIYMRGVDYVQVPTTLLAQVDSSVGGKTAIDLPQGKNLVGAFHQPRRVLADLDVLATLPARQMRAGFAEVLKIALVGDADFLTWLEANLGGVLGGQPAALEHAVARSVQMKADIVAADERETTGARALLNLGHTFGHALEARAGFGEALLHGEAVAVGCAMALRLSARLALCDLSDAARVARVVEAAGLPSRLEQLGLGPISAGELLGKMKGDKKAGRGGVVLVLARAIGQAVLVPDVDDDALRAFLISEGAEP